MKTYLSSQIRGTIFKLALSASILSMVGCDDDSSKGSKIVPSNNINAVIEIYKEKTGHVFSQVQLREQGRLDVSVRLEKGDQLWFSTGEPIGRVSTSDDLFAGLVELGNTHELLEPRYEYGDSDSLFDSWINYGDLWYTGFVENTEADLYRLSLLRDTHAEAPDSTVSMPETFALTGVAANKEYSRNQDTIVVQWDGAAETDVESYARVSISCANSEIGSFSDAQVQTFDYDLGTQVDQLILPAGDLNDELLSGRCSGTISIRRSRLGTLDDAFAGGYIRASQLRSISFVSID